MTARARSRLTLETLEDRVLPAADVVLDWNLVLQQALRNDQHYVGPGWSSRNAAIVHGAIYDALNAVLPTGEAYLEGLKNPPNHIDPEAAAAGAAWWTLRKLYGDQKEYIDTALQNALVGIPDTGNAEKNGVQYGKYVAKEYLKLRNHDHASSGQGHYHSQNKPGHWQPTDPAHKKPIGPKWGEVDPFVLTSADQFAPPPPPALDSSEYTMSYLQVKSLGALNSTTRTADQTEIAIFWAYDRPGLGTPVTLYNQVVATIAVQEGNNLMENARLFALANFAMADAGIACWDSKYVEDFWRPVTAIHEAKNDGNPLTTADQDWQPLSDQINGITPPFPAYVSGHSTFGGAVFGVLEYFYGTDDISFTLTSDELAGVTRDFDSFSEANEENALSRIYLGVHWDFDCTEGMTLGASIADFVTSQTLRANPTSPTSRSFQATAAAEQATTDALTADPRLTKPADETATEQNQTARPAGSRSWDTLQPAFSNAGQTYEASLSDLVFASLKRKEPALDIDALLA